MTSNTAGLIPPQGVLPGGRARTASSCDFDETNDGLPKPCKYNSEEVGIQLGSIVLLGCHELIGVDQLTVQQVVKEAVRPARRGPSLSQQVMKVAALYRPMLIGIWLKIYSAV